MAKIRSLKYIQNEIKKVQASIRKNAKGKAVAKAKEDALKFLDAMSAELEDKCKQDDPTDSYSAVPTEALTAAKTTLRKKGTAKK